MVVQGFHRFFQSMGFAVIEMVVARHVFDQSNVILGAAVEEYVPEFGDFVTAILTAGEALSNLRDEVPESKVGVDTGDLTSVLVNFEAPCCLTRLCCYIVMHSLLTYSLLAFPR